VASQITGRLVDVREGPMYVNDNNLGSAVSSSLCIASGESILASDIHCQAQELFTSE
jgi:hypothetical protein